ncbi:MULTISPECIES: SDR family oxidoreductase [Sphingobium]|jgi:short-subunit dehydrogenase|uniref:SDR family oxidoreductase n=2 Tax=Sphingobium fuliginis (strain ATCC 27551) TaxID=336203 RepID=A0A4Q4IXV4_SPHSA|nr:MULTISPECIES: SDR family oxidoreductase [Sphingobium]AJR23429.1 AraC family transcriptional regulator [Sphingobium sp. YBL2]MCB4860249.1 SDR family oxidoreductase [Sphingobium sp. PNB]PNQ00332.1 SDR family oxidoreductase [Sphingobium sp. SA916]QDC39899.1 SDR family oxidoreductase [Sphingobium fuliginis ATCC 27551]QOT74111.1 SDR family oxidoreductase [Sphingobium fuliginis]
MTQAEKNIALITGASTGIGAVYADRLARRGFDLILVARDRPRLDALAERLRGEAGVDVEVIAADLTAEGDLQRIEERLAAGDVTMLVNNAGMSLNGGILDNDTPQLSRIIALNVTAPTRLASAAGKAFVAAGRGAIVNLSSVLALAPEMFDGVYSGTKAFILNLSQSMATQLRDKGVRVQAVLPGATRTEIWARSGKDVDAFPAGFVMEAGDMVDAALLGFDRGETVTIPPLSDEQQWLTLQEARLAMGPNLSKSDVAPRYRDALLTA